ncbi:MBL fold metallo-hydrolase [Pseudomonadota bacterium]
MIKVLREGIHDRVEDAPSHVIFNPIFSSAILILTEGIKILVDPGHIGRFQELVDALSAEGLKPEDIDLVFLTHHHLDHASSMGSFPNAKIYLENGFVTQKDSSYTVYRDLSKVELPSTCSVIETPGHTLDSRSLLFEEDGVKYICAGDSVREDVIRSGEKIAWDDEELFKKSLKMIFGLAEVIIPGHGRVIEGENKDELQKFVDKY